MHFGMTSVDSEPTKNVYEGPQDHNPNKEEYVRKIVRSFIDKHVMNNIQDIDLNSRVLENNLTRRYCGKQYVHPKWLRKHEEREHGHNINTSKTQWNQQTTLLQTTTK